VQYAGDAHDAAGATIVNLVAQPLPKPTVSTVVKKWVGPDAVWVAVTVQTQRAATLHFSDSAGFGLPPDARVPAGGGIVDAVVQGLSPSPTAVTITATNAGGSTSDTENLVADDVVFYPSAAVAGDYKCLNFVPGSAKTCGSFTVSVPAGSYSESALEALTGRQQQSGSWSLFEQRSCMSTPAAGTYDCAVHEHDQSLTQFTVTKLGSAGGSTTFRFAQPGGFPLGAPNRAIPPADPSPATISDSHGPVPATSVGLLADDAGVRTPSLHSSVELVTVGGGPLTQSGTWVVGLADGEKIQLGGIVGTFVKTETCGSGNVPIGDIADCLNVYDISYGSRKVVPPTLPTVSGQPSFASGNGTVTLSCAVAACGSVRVEVNNPHGSPPDKLIAHSSHVTVTGAKAVTLVYTTYGKNLYSSLKSQKTTNQESLDIVFTGLLGDVFTVSKQVTFP
jgi:hypothetical protein